MQTVQSRTGETLRNADAFLEQNASTFPNIANSGARKKLRTALAGVSAHAEGQAGHGLLAKGTTQKYFALRSALLRDHMSPIAGIALAELPNTPEVAPLRMPTRRTSAETVFLAAKAMSKAAEPFSQVFIDAGLAPDFLVQLDAAADAMLALVDLRAQTQGRRTGATKGMTDQLRQGRKAIGALDRMLTSALKDDPALLANWKTLKRVRRSTSSGGAAAPVETPAPSAAA